MSGRMNKSLDERLVPNGEYVNAMNIRVNSTEASEVGAVENTLGNVSLTTLTYNGTPLSASAKTIGYFADGANETIYWFVHSPADGVDMVVSYNDNTNAVTYHVISTSVLNFNENYLITGVDKIDDLLFWTDNLNPPRRINVKRSYPSEPSLTAADLNVIVAPPVQSPSISLINLPGQENYIETRLISFAYRYKYKDGEYSALSQFSKLAFQPGFFRLNLGTFQNEGMLNQFNAVQVSFNTGNEDVVGIDLCFKIANLSVINVIDRFDKRKQGWADNSIVTQVFTNKKVYTTLPETELVRLFDNVPTKAQAQTMMGNRIIYGNYTDGFDLTDSDGDPVKIDYEVELVSEEIENEEIPFTAQNYTYPVSAAGVFSTEDSSLVIDFSGKDLSEGNSISITINVDHADYSGTDEPTGFQPGFTISGTITLQQSYSSVYDFSVSQEFKKFIGSESFHGAFEDCGTSLQLNSLTDSFICAVSNYAQWVKVQFGVDSPNQGIKIQSAPGNNSITLTLPYIKYESPDPGSLLYEYFRNASAQVGFREAAVTGSLHSNRSYSVGIVYMDEYNRSSTVLLSENNTVFVPASASTKRNYIKVTIPDTQKVPFWATRYKFLILPSGMAYETLYSNRFFIDPFDGSTWFRLEGDNQNKVRTGDLLVVKVDSNGALNRLVETTVLEISAREEDFIKENTDEDGVEIKEPTGLYMRVQPIGWSAFYREDQIVGGEKVESGKGDNPRIAIPVSEEDPDNPGSFIPWTISSGDIVRFDLRFHRDEDLANGCRSRIYTFSKEYVSNADYSDLRNFVNSERINFASGVASGQDEIENDNEYNSALGSSISSVPREQNVNHYQFVQEANGKMSLVLSSGTPKCRPFLKTNWSYLDGSVTIIRSGGLFVFETQPEESNTDIYYEGYQSHSITADAHDETVINLDLFNCFSFGNGVESYKVRDALAAPFFNIGHRVSSVASQEFKQANRYASLTYSGVYNPETNLNNLNQFNLGLANFKDLEKRWGPIMKLYARQTDILVLQEDRISYVLSGKNLLSDSSGGGAVASIPEVLGTQIARQEEFGISFHPESFAVFGYDKFFTDAKRGVVIRLSGMEYSKEQLEPISDLGMKEWFRQLFIDSLQTQKLGGYDPFSREYVLSSNDIQKPEEPIVLPCGSSYQLPVAPASSSSVVFELDEIVGNFSVNFSTVSGTITEITVNYNGVDTVRTTQSGTISLSKISAGSGDVVTITVESTVGANVSVKTTCPQGQQVTIFKICVNSNTYKGKVIHNENLVTGRTIVSSDLVELQDGSGLVVSQFDSTTGFKGSSVYPTNAQNVRIRSNKKFGDTLDFLPGTHKLRYYESNTLYNESDIEFLIDNSSVVSTTQSGGVNFADYAYGNSRYIYLIYDYRLPVELDACYSNVLPLDACCSCDVTTTTTTTTTTTLPYSTFALYLKTDVGTGWDDSLSACQGTGSIFFLFAHPGYSTLQDLFNDGKKIFSNTSLTNVYNGQGKWFKTAQLPSQGRTIQIGSDGFINQIGSNC